jgi:hypothetical protein
VTPADLAAASVERPILLDGGLATELEAAGHDLSGALWSGRLLLDSPEVKRMDLAMLGAEAQQLLKTEPEWVADLGVEPAKVNVTEPWTPETAEGFFLSRFNALFSVR